MASGRSDDAECVDAVLLAGGFGTRLRPLTYTRPKPLLPVAGRPMLEWMLDRLPPQVERVIVAVNWQAERMEEYFRNSDRDLEFVVVREGEPLGTAGAVRNCQEHIRTDRFFVLNADIVSAVDLDAMLEQHRRTSAEVTIALKQVPWDAVVHYGVASMDEREPRRIIGFVEKPRTPSEAPSRLINAGAYLLDRRTLRRIPDGMVSMEKDIFPGVIRAGAMWGVPFDGTWVDVGDPTRLRAASRALANDKESASAAGVTGTVADSVLGAGCVVEADALVVESVLGDNVIVRAGAILRHCTVGDDQVIDGEHVDERLWAGPPPEGYPTQQVGNQMNAI